ncbi:DeoR/GlpR family DNA-binding transcription regulator [Telluribacter sp. SYSU D00476]|uniref:DeoR/GlpR family DNA-binding transcription regulator n=1 Tax=Telluribacter sp. SYSU D00476 TaxID=2811430 RepID=UPI001FF117FF|nr:DeoR/GlpR family DNA-binding transcription regulator [Telluribacter sp. SYSU D00476]
MTQRQRLHEITRYVRKHGELTVSRACELFGASSATIRRDFSLLMEEGAVSRTWGGISRKEEEATDLAGQPAWLRETLFADEKKKIAATAASLVEDGDVVMIDGGTTTYHMARYLANRPVTVITNSILIAHQIDLERQSKYGAEVLVTGGLIYPEAGMLVGPQAIKNIREYYARWAFLSVGGIEAEGVTNSSQLVVETQRAIMEQCETRVLLADHSKFGRKSLCRLCGIGEIDLLITDSPPGQADLIDNLRSRGLHVVQTN